MSDRSAEMPADGCTESRKTVTSNRREFVAVGASLTTALVAGCVGGDGGDENGNESENGGANGNESENGDENGGANGNENGDENGGANGNENGDENGGANGNESENGDENGDADPAPAELSVSSLDIDGQGDEATVESGSTGPVAVTVENVGEQTGSFNVTLSAGNVSRSQTAELAGGESRALTFEEMLSELESGTQSFTVAANGVEISGDAGGQVTVEEPAQPAAVALSGLDIAGQGTEATVESGSDGVIEVTVENVGEQAGSFDVTLSAGSVVRPEQTDEIEAGGSQTLTFEDVLADLAAGTYEVTVTAGTDTVVGQMTVEEGEPEMTDGEEFRSLFTEGTDYEFEITSDQGSSMSGRFRGGNQYIRLEGPQGGEFYRVDDTVYSVQDGQCLIVPSTPIDTIEPPAEDDLDDATLSSITRVGTDTIDGEQVIVFEASGAGFGPNEATYYLLADSGRLRRMEFVGQQGEQQIDFLAWGDEVAPITPPDMECQSVQG